jgi:hypothetical protein
MHVWRLNTNYSVRSALFLSSTVADDNVFYHNNSNLIHNIMSTYMHIVKLEAVTLFSNNSSFSLLSLGFTVAIKASSMARSLKLSNVDLG